MQIRSTTDEDFDVFVDTVHTAFGRFPDTPVDGGGLWWSALEAERCLLARTDDGRPVGTAAAYSFELTLPGESVTPASGVTAVGVLPTHRRRGLLSALMRHQLAGLRERGEYVSVLLASEAPIYGRFGYGPATYAARLTVPRHNGTFAASRAGAGAGTEGLDSDSGGGPGLGSGSDAGLDSGSDSGSGFGSVEVLPRAACGDILAEVYDRYRRAQPGALSRPRIWWDRRAGRPPISPAPRHIALHRDADGVPDGYASYSMGEGGTLTVDETIATDDGVYAELARFVLGHDLASRVVFASVSTDHPLRRRFADFRAAEVSDDSDWLWVRLLDVPRALTARGWCTDGELVLDVDDPFLGEHGRHLLTVRDGRADCVPTDRAPDLSLDVRDLGSVYLGGTAPSTLVRAGHIRAHRPGAAALADALFHAERPPYCLHWF
ncbi:MULTISPECIES: GNAT family N-acetyltransferase [unclassified Streptomyces]|uniref:GNAT family N-acetyltransferase n=1 Tax=unclassified Streptomyces TaxID=2593676 RepID=UPI0033EF9E13